MTSPRGGSGAPWARVTSPWGWARWRRCAARVRAGPGATPSYRGGGSRSGSLRPPRPAAADPATGERYPDVIVFWVPSESDKQALVQDQASPFFTTPHFDGHPSVLVRGSRIGELSVRELAEVIQDAWLAQASRARAATWLEAHTGG